MDNTILYNEETTAQTLNNIAVDLGKTDFSVFSDGETYAVTKLNEITSSLVSKGILTSGSRCKPTISNDILEIADGIIVFSSGQKIKITEPIQLTVSQTGTYYIYAVNNLEANTASIEVLTEELLTGDYVPLCTVTDGILTDERKIANAKVNLNVTKVQTITLNETISSAISEDDCTEIEIPVDGDDFNYIMFPMYLGGYTVYDIKRNKREGFGYDPNYDNPHVWLGDDQKKIYYRYSDWSTWRYTESVRFVSLENGILTLGFNHTASKNGIDYSTGNTTTFTQTLILC